LPRFDLLLSHHQGPSGPGAGLEAVGRLRALAALPTPRIGP
jgi:hypothetical protein